MYGRRLSWLALIAIVTAACGSGSEPASQPPAATPAASRVFFEEPQDGAMVKSPVHLKFGIENFAIAAVPAVPEGTTLTTARPAMGHHHVAVDAECLPVGSVIPKAAPWVHFGTGNNEIDMQLAPGPHTLTLQIGDDLHTTMTGLCATIHVTVTE